MNYRNSDAKIAELVQSDAVWGSEPTAAPTEKRHVSVSVEEWDALNARLRDAEEKLHALQSGAANPANTRESTTSERVMPTTNEFLAMLAHEFRNPLAPIRSAVEIMSLIAQKDAALDKARELIARQVEHLSRLVDDLLDVARMTQGKITLREKPVDVNSVLSAAVEIVRPLIDERGHELTVVPLTQPASVEGEFTRLVQVVGNLLNNAAKYTEPGGVIALSAETENDLVLIRVTDNGIGIAPDLLPHIFDLFTQAPRVEDGPPGGLGIGLSLVRNLVVMHGGSVAAMSDGPAQGSEFVVKLPLARSPMAAEPAAPGDGAHQMPRRIIVIDDNHDAAESLAMLLRLKGHEVHVAYDGPSGVSLALKCAPDCALVDIGLPGIDGYEVAKRLRSHPNSQGLLLIALTGYGQSEDRIRSEQAGFDHHLVKPVAQKVLEDLIQGR